MYPTDHLVLLKNITLLPDNTHTILFDSGEAQQAFFASNILQNYGANLSVISENKPFVDVPSNSYAILDGNYIMFKNKDYSDKWFYAFVIKIEFIAQSTARIWYDIDEIQTYMFDWEIRHCFVEREHIAVDGIGFSQVEENLPISLNNYVTNGNIIQFNELEPMAILMTVSELADGTKVSGTLRNNIYSGLALIPYHISDYNQLNTDLIAYAEAGKLEAIVNITMYPESLLGTFTSGVQLTRTIFPQVTKTIPANLTAIDNYTPKNKKLFQYPFKLLYVSNNNGTTHEYRYELTVADPNLNFMIEGSPTEQEIGLIPINYARIPANFDEMLILNNFPICGWNGDVFKNWFAQNKVSTFLSVASTVAQAAFGFANAKTNLDGVQTGTNAVIATLNTIGSVITHSTQPNTAKQGNKTGVNAVLNLMTFTAYCKSIDNPTARIIDDFFYMYGYQTNELKIPNLKTRPFWNYIKCADVNIFGNIPAPLLNKIRSRFLNGITFWHGNYIGDYARDNAA